MGGFGDRGLGGLGLLAAPLRLAAALGDPFIDQGDGFGQGDAVLGLVARDGGVDPARGDIGAVAATLDRDAAERWMIAERLAGISAEPPAARALGDLLRDQRHRAIEPDVEHLVAGLKAGIGFLVPHEWPETAQARGDRLAGLRMLADLARQRQQFQRQFELDVAGRHRLRNTGALRFFALGIVLRLAELDIGAEPSGFHHDVATGYRVLAKDAVGAGFTVGRQRAGVAAFRIIGAADKRAELAGLEIELAVAAAWALPGIAAILARRVDVRPQHVVQRIQHLGDAQILYFIDRANETDPEIPQHLLPGDLVVGNPVELLFEVRSEVILDVAGEEVLQEGDHDAALVLAMQPLLLELDVAAVLQHLQNRGVGRRPADAEFFHALDQRGLREARRRFREVLGDGEFLALQRLARAHRGQAARILVLAVIVAPFLVERKKAIELDHLAGGAQFQQPRTGLGRDIDSGALEFGGFHLAGDGADPDQLIEPCLIAIEAVAQRRRATRQIGRADGLVRLLRVLRLGLVLPRRLRHIGFAIILADHLARLHDR